MVTKSSSKYPWYQELVAISCLGYILWSATENFPKLPQQMAVHFDMNGFPNGWSSPATALGIVLVMFFMSWGVDSFVRFQFAIKKPGKHFNWASMLTAPYLTLCPWVWFILVDFNLNGTGAINYRINILLSAGAIALVYAVLSELVRPANDLQAHPLGPSKAARELPLRNSDKFVYIDKHNSTFWAVLCFVSILVIIPSIFAMLYGYSKTGSMLLLFCGFVSIPALFFMLLASRGFHYVVRPNGVDIKFGFMGINLKHIPIEEITNVSFENFNPIADYGGWGVRKAISSNTWAYIISGTEGVRIETKDKNYVLASKDAQTMIELINKVRAN